MIGGMRSRSSHGNLKNSVPKSIFPLTSKVGKDIQSYFPSELASEMSGLAKAFGAPLQVGDLVAVNLVMQLEHIALNCSNWLFAC